MKCPVCEEEKPCECDEQEGEPETEEKPFVWEYPRDRLKKVEHMR